MDTGSEGTPIARESNCVNCDRWDSADNLVQCDQCDAWWHMSCAGVSQSVENRQWICQTCLQEFGSIQTVSRTPASRSPRLELQLRKLEEQYALERNFLEEKYKLLEREMDSPLTSIGNQVSSRMSEADFDKVRQWIDSCADGQLGGGFGRTNTPSLTMHTSRNCGQKIADDPAGIGGRMPIDGITNDGEIESNRRCLKQRTSNQLFPGQQAGSNPLNDSSFTRMGPKPTPRPRRLVFEDNRNESENVGSYLPVPPARSTGKSPNDPMYYESAQQSVDMNLLCRHFEDIGLSRSHPVETMPHFSEFPQYKFGQSNPVPARRILPPPQHSSNITQPNSGFVPKMVKRLEVGTPRNSH